LVDDRDRAYFGRGGQEDDKIGFLDENTRAIFGRSYAAEPDVLVEHLRKDEAIAEADTLLLTIPNQLGVAYNAHVMEAILTTVAPALGWCGKSSPHLLTIGYFRSRPIREWDHKVCRYIRTSRRPTFDSDASWRSATFYTSTSWISQASRA
jgi:hypothetical protein